jgi:hypothetical protein
VILNSVVAGLGILGRTKLPEAEKEEKSPPDEKSEHEPVNDIDEVVYVAAVIGKILRNPEPFGPIERNKHEKRDLRIGRRSDVIIAELGVEA